MTEKKDRLEAFIRDETHLGAFGKVKKEVFRILRHIGPREAEADIIFGFDDPARTGQVLAALSMLYPVIGRYTNITPDFEKRILKGRLRAKGHVRACQFLLTCVKLILCGNVRTTYRDIRNFEL